MFLCHSVKKTNTDRSVFIVEILQSKSKTIMSKKRKLYSYVFLSKKTNTDRSVFL